MKSLKQAILLGLALWAIRFASTAALSTWFIYGRIGVPVYPRLMSDLAALSPAVILAAATSVFIYIYFKDVVDSLIKEAVLLGITWTAINVGLDLLALFSGRAAALMIYGLTLPYPGGNIPFHYFRANALSYFLIPLLTINAGDLLSSRDNKLAKGLVYGLAIASGLVSS